MTERMMQFDEVLEEVAREYNEPWYSAFEKHDDEIEKRIQTKFGKNTTSTKEYIDWYNETCMDI